MDPVKGHYLDNYDPGRGKIYGQIQTPRRKISIWLVKAAEEGFRGVWSKMSIDKEKQNPS